KVPPGHPDRFPDVIWRRLPAGLGQPAQQETFGGAGSRRGKLEARDPKIAPGNTAEAARRFKDGIAMRCHDNLPGSACPKILCSKPNFNPFLAWSTWLGCRLPTL